MHSESLQTDPVATFVCQNFGLLLGICIMLIIALYEEDLMAVNFWELGRESDLLARTDWAIFFFLPMKTQLDFEHLNCGTLLFLGYVSSKKK